MERSEEFKKYLANKHKGGENNQKGGLYEDYYAVYLIVSCIAKFKSKLDAVSFQTQLEDTFVDDLLVAFPDKNVYHQLKNAKKVVWGKKEKIGDIAFDFSHQIEDCKERDEDFALKLIYSANDAQVNTNMPTEIKEHTEVKWFPYREDLNHLVLISVDFKKALRDISAEGDNATDDVLVVIATRFLGVWKSSDNKSRISLSEIVKRVEAQSWANIAIFPDARISEECKAVLDATVGFEYRIQGKMLYWNIGSVSGSFIVSKELEKYIINNRPSTKRDFLTMTF